MLLVVFILAPLLIFSLEVKEHSLEGTYSEADGLSQKQLAILRYFAYLTFLTDGDPDPWKPWKVDDKLPRSPFSDLRYQVSDVAYATAVVAQRTPAYTEIYNKILKSAAGRMLLEKVWKYSKRIYPKNETNEGSDPLSWKNIMYSGHLSKTMALHQLISGDMTYSDNSWDFVNGKYKTTYNLTGVMYAMYNQMLPPGGSPPAWGDWYDGGGVPCEPFGIFLLCNNFPHNAFQIHDGIHGTNFKNADYRWQNTVSGHCVNKPLITASYFKVIYMLASRGWIPDTPIEGGDHWTLAWIRGWWNETNSAEKEVIYKGYEHLANSKGWKIDNQTNGTYHTGVPDSFDPIATSFFPMIERQFWNPSSSLTTKSVDIMRYFEQYGELIDTDGDGIKDSYRYAKEHDDYRDAVNGNLLLAMVFPNDGSKNNIIRDLFQANPPFYKKYIGQPRIDHVDYPSVMVPVARYDLGTKVLHFQLISGDKSPASVTQVILLNCNGLKSVTLNKKIFNDYKQGKTSGSIILSAPPPTNNPQIWEFIF